MSLTPQQLLDTFLGSSFVGMPTRMFGSALPSSEQARKPVPQRIPVVVEPSIPRSASASGGRGVTPRQAQASVDEWSRIIEEGQKSAPGPETEAVTPPEAGTEGGFPDQNPGLDPGQTPDLTNDQIINNVRMLMEYYGSIADQNQKNALARSIVTASLRDRGLRELSRRKIAEANIDAWKALQVERERARSNQAIALMNTAYLSMIPNAGVMQAMNEATKAAMTGVNIPTATVRYKSVD